MKRVDGIWSDKRRVQMITNSTREKWKMKLKTIQEAVEYNYIELNEWEEGFLDSVEKLLTGGSDISIQQSISLNRIYGKI
jgi:hypothetical protein